MNFLSQELTTMSQHSTFRANDKSSDALAGSGNFPDSGCSKAAADAYPPLGSDTSDRQGHTGTLEAFGEMFSFSGNSGAHESTDTKAGAKGDQNLSALVFSPEGQKMLYSSNNSSGAKAADAMIQRAIDG